MVLLCVPLVVLSQNEDVDNEFEAFARESQQQYDAFSKESERQYNSFRDSVNNEYARFVRQAWKEYAAFAAVPLPKEEPVPPVVIPEEDRNKPIEDCTVVIKEMVKPVLPTPLPRPVEPIPEIKPKDDEEPVKTILDQCLEESKPEPPIPKPTPKPWPEKKEPPLRFRCYGTAMEVSIYDRHRFSIGMLNDNHIADVWSRLSSSDYNNLLRDCLDLRTAYHLCDWAYKNMLDSLSFAYFGRSCNEATLLKAFIFCQSGYAMRLARDGDRLMMLYASQHTLFNKPAYIIEGTRFYVDGDTPENLHVCQASYPNEQPLSLQILDEQYFASDWKLWRTLQIDNRKKLTVEVPVNRNTISFCQDYPSSMLHDNFMTRWAMYAQTPMEQSVRTSLYSVLQIGIRNRTQEEAANYLLNFVQTGFTYQYDTVVWGEDRAFFAEETLYYPYSDCEDRSILFSHLIRDLLGLDVALIYEPGHLLTAVHFTEEIEGTSVSIEGKKFILCDPTCITGAPIGWYADNGKSREVQVIALEKISYEESYQMDYSSSKRYTIPKKVLTIVAKNNKYGLKNAKGELVVDYKYDSIKEYSNGEWNQYAAYKNQEIEVYDGMENLVIHNISGFIPLDTYYGSRSGGKEWWDALTKGKDENSWGYQSLVTSHTEDLSRYDVEAVTYEQNIYCEFVSVDTIEQAEYFIVLREKESDKFGVLHLSLMDRLDGIEVEDGDPQEGVFIPFQYDKIEFVEGDKSKVKAYDYANGTCETFPLRRKEKKK